MLLQTINQQFVIEKWTDFISNDEPNVSKYSAVFLLVLVTIF
jgi:hypothetical protein